MQIFIKGPTGKIYTLEVEPSDLIEKVRIQLKEKSGIARGVQRIIFAGKQLENGRTLADYGVRKESSLSVCVRCPPIAIHGTPVFVKMPAGKTIDLEVKSRDTIQNVKVKIEQKEGIPPAVQRLTLAGQLLEDDYAASEYDIREDSIINLEILSV